MCLCYCSSYHTLLYKHNIRHHNSAAVFCYSLHDRRATHNCSTNYGSSNYGSSNYNTANYGTTPNHDFWL